MGTRSFITIKHKDNTYSGVYCHWDGYPEWNGEILKKDYQARSKVVDLIDGGDMSCCWTDDRWDDSGVKGVYGPQYYSQRGEDSPPVMHKDLNEFLVYSDSDCGCEYAYHFVDGEWVCHQVQDYRDPNVVKEVSIPEGALAV